MSVQARMARAWLFIVVFSLGGLWYGSKGAYQEIRAFIERPPGFNPWQSSFMLGYWVFAFVLGTVLIGWTLVSLGRGAEQSGPESGACGKCGRPRSGGARFCGSCGTPFA